MIGTPADTDDLARAHESHRAPTAAMPRSAASPLRFAVVAATALLATSR